ncbi:MAG: rhodanese-like domain-containing protein [Desulfuromonadia bacterium]
MKQIHNLALALTTAALVGCASTHGTSPKGLERPIEKAAVKFAADVTEGKYRIVTTDELKTWLDSGKQMTIISTLPPEEDREFGKIPGAVNGAIPKTEKELTEKDVERIVTAAGSDKDRTIVTYCGFVACRRSHLGAKILVEKGYRNVYRNPGGITGWSEAGYPLVK